MTRKIIIHILFLFIISTFDISAQIDSDTIIKYNQSLAKFHGDESGKKFQEFMSKTIVYPENAKLEQIDGRVVVQFLIDSTGLITDINIKRSLRDDFDNEVIKAIKLSPRWSPAMIDNKAISQYYIYIAKFYNDKKKIRGFRKQKTDK